MFKAWNYLENYILFKFLTGQIVGREGNNIVIN